MSFVEQNKKREQTPESAQCGLETSLRHSRPQSPRSFWPVAGIESSGLVQHQKSAIHRLPVKSGNSDWLKYETNTQRIIRKSGPARALDPCRRPEGSWALGTQTSRRVLSLNDGNVCSKRIHFLLSTKCMLFVIGKIPFCL